MTTGRAPDAAAAMRAEGLRPSAWSNGPGDRYAAHEHGYDKVLVAERGSITFLLDAGPIQLDAGDRLDLPAGIRHGAHVGPHGVTCLEAHLPAGSLVDPPRAIAGWLVAAAARATRTASDERA